MNDPRLDAARKLAEAAQQQSQTYIQNGMVADAKVLDEVIFKLCGAINNICDVVQRIPINEGGGVAYDTQGGLDAKGGMS